MNQYFFEFEAKQKLRNLRDEGQRSQAVHRSGIRSDSARQILPRMAVVIGTLAGLILLLVR
ncbi:MAG TPA: hypothetical protein VLY63_26950 [Anaerolineae bacterium]|nr:hypothetical protein [Anaerolineae bacterium]